jgi:hypothetical protein
MVKGIGPLFGLEVDGERKNLFGTLAKAKELEIFFVAQGCKVAIFEHSDAEIKARDAVAAEEQFMKLGVQYYVAARQSAWSGLWVCGNLYHHALEMFLKAGLSRKYSLPELRKQFCHELIPTWNAFKADFSSPALSEFNATIADIAGFEDIRYPDKVVKYGAQIIIDYRAQPREPSLRPEPEYRLDFYEIDRLIGAIFGASSQNPLFYMSDLKPDVRAMLARDNPVAAQLLCRPLSSSSAGTDGRANQMPPDSYNF